MEKAETIQFTMNDWLSNAGIVGIHNILDNADLFVQENENALSMNADDLDEFSHYYFKYFLDQYEPLSSYAKIMAYQEKFDHWQQNDYEDFSSDDYAAFKEYLQKTLKYYVKANSFKKIYPLMVNHLDVIEATKKLPKLINLTKKNNFKVKRAEIIVLMKEMAQQIKPIYDYFTAPDAKKYFPVLSTLYTVVNNTWTNISYFNRSNKEPDFYIAYEKTFIEPVREYLTVDHTKDKYHCNNCNRPVANTSLSYSFLSDMGFDIGKKTSNVWDFANDLTICPICQLMYSCSSAGFNFIYGHGLFVNSNNNLGELISINRKINQEIWQSSEERHQVTPYAAMIRTLTEQQLKDKEYVLDDVQVIEYENEHYRFNILPRNIVRLFKKDAASFNRLRGANYLLNGTRHYVYEEVADHVLNSQNLFLYVNQILKIYVSQPTAIFIQAEQVDALLNINHDFLEGMKN